MKILWVRNDLLHPTRYGGQVVMLEILRRLRERHEIHVAAYEREYNVGGAEHAGEYCSRLHKVAPPVFPSQLRPYALEVLREEFLRRPPAVRALTTKQMRETVARLAASEGFDVIVADSCYMAANIPDLPNFVLFQQNVETVLIRRRLAVETAWLLRRSVQREASQMFAYELESCTRAAEVIAISEQDAKTMAEVYGLSKVTPIRTGVDADHFAPPAEFSTPPPRHDLVFLGAMSWTPNRDAVQWFVAEILPRIHSRLPTAKLAVVGYGPDSEIRALGERDSRITVTGAVDDVRPWLWGGSGFVVPIRYGGGIRIKILEAMAAGIPVISTRAGADGLGVRCPEHICLEDKADSFADSCLRLLADEKERRRMSLAARTFVGEHFNWDNTTREVEAILWKVARTSRR